jgi:hypothetical protein
MFASDAEAQQSGRKVGLARNRGSAFDGRLDAAQAGGMADDPDRSADGVGGSAPPSTSDDTTAPKPRRRVGTNGGRHPPEVLPACWSATDRSSSGHGHSCPATG